MGSLPWPDGPPGAFLLAALSMLLLFCGPWLVAYLRHRPAVVAGFAAVSLAATWPAPDGAWPPAGWRLVACDVGQGDGLALATTPGHAVVVDTGPDPPPMDACLRRLRVSVVDALVLTHFHADHVDGVPGVLRGRAVVRQVLTSPVPEPDYQARRGHARGPARQRCRCSPLRRGHPRLGPGHGAGPVARQGDPRGLGAQQRQRRPGRRRSRDAAPAARRRRAGSGTPGAARPAPRPGTTRAILGSTCSRWPTTGHACRTRSSSRRRMPGWRWSASARATPTATRPPRRWRCCAAPASRRFRTDERGDIAVTRDRHRARARPHDPPLTALCHRRRPAGPSAPLSRPDAPEARIRNSMSRFGHSGAYSGVV